MDENIETVVEALFKKVSTDWNETQFLTYVENGISSPKKKCEQAHNNALCLQAEIMKSYHIARNIHRKHNKNKVLHTPPFSIQRGIATWFDYTRMDERIEDYDTSVGIMFTAFPMLSDENIETLLRRLNSFQSKERRNTVRHIKRMLYNHDLADLYDLISQGESNDSAKDGDIRGFISEMTLYFSICESASKTEGTANVFRNISAPKQELRYNSSGPIIYGFQYEADVTVHTVKENVMAEVFKNLSAQDYAKVFYNPKATPFTVS